MTHPIKRRHDGSIDIGHYQALGRRARSDAFHASIRPSRKPRRAHRAGVALPAVLVLALACLPLLV